MVKKLLVFILAGSALLADEAYDIAAKAEKAARQKAAAPADQPPPPAQRLKLQTDAILDGLILKLEPKR